MSVGGIRGGGRSGGPKGPKGAGGKGSAAKSGKSFGVGSVGKSESLVGASREAGTANAGGVGGTGAAAGAGPTDPVTAQALEIAKMLKSGQLKSKEEATKKLVDEILKEKLRMQSKALTSRITDSLQEDPRLNQALERLWAKG